MFNQVTRVLLAWPNLRSPWLKRIFIPYPSLWISFSSKGIPNSSRKAFTFQERHGDMKWKMFWYWVPKFPNTFFSGPLSPSFITASSKRTYTDLPQTKLMNSKSFLLLCWNLAWERAKSIGYILTWSHWGHHHSATCSRRTWFKPMAFTDFTPTPSGFTQDKRFFCFRNRLRMLLVSSNLFTKSNGGSWSAS